MFALAYIISNDLSSYLNSIKIASTFQLLKLILFFWLWHQSDDTRATPKVIANLDTDSKQASSEEGSNASDDSEDTEQKDAPPLIPDLLVGISHLLYVPFYEWYT